MNENSFFSVNRLVEFGLSLALAQQMVQMMNYTLANSHIPGTVSPPNFMQSQSTSFFYAIIDGRQVGPLSIEQLSQFIAEKKIDSSTYIWKPGMPTWKLSAEVPEIVRMVALSPPPFPSNTDK